MTQLVERPRFGSSAVPDDRDAVTQLLRHVELMRRQHDRLALFFGQAANPLFHGAGSLNVKT